MDWVTLFGVIVIMAVLVLFWFVCDLLMGWSSWGLNQEHFRHEGLPGYQFWEYYHEIWHFGDAWYVATHRNELEARIWRKADAQRAAIYNKGPVK